jgi:NitT/TauT family transport system permease protein/putative hydroxymethylpyrimidine transport system permease protein
VKRWFSAVALVCILIGAWEIYVDAGGVNSLLLASPHQIAASLWNDRSLLWSNFLVSGEEIVLGVLVAVPAGMALSILLHTRLTVRTAVYPLLVASQTVPIPMIAPLLVLWLGFGIGPKLFIIALVSFFSIVVATLDALSAVDAEVIKTMRTLDASRWELFRFVELPAALPGVFTGARIAMPIAVIGDVLGEQAGSNSGLGYIFQQSIPQLLTARAYATVVILSVFAITLFALITVGERYVLPWTHQPVGET